MSPTCVRTPIYIPLDNYRIMSELIRTFSLMILPFSVAPVLIHKPFIVHIHFSSFNSPYSPQRSHNIYHPTETTLRFHTQGSVPRNLVPRNLATLIYFKSHLGFQAFPHGPI